MDQNKWEKYEAKKKEIKKISAKEKLKVWLFCLIYNIIADITLWLAKDLITYPLAFTLFLISTLLSIYIALKAFVAQHNIEMKQLKLAEQEEPFGRFRT